MSGLTEDEREALDETLWSGSIHDDMPAAVEQIIAAREQAARDAALAPIEAVAEEWATEGPSLVKHAYGARDAHVGATLELCAIDLRAAIRDARGGAR